ncbi:MAG: hypothetical protein H7Y37_10775 [Anaerolineae bacterium]|nr:hypothetical protein [Gloeobacterales cyanobacterium ES-bin-313]
MCIKPPWRSLLLNGSCQESWINSDDFWEEGVYREETTPVDHFKIANRRI